MSSEFSAPPASADLDAAAFENASALETVDASTQFIGYNGPTARVAAFVVRDVGTEGSVVQVWDYRDPENPVMVSEITIGPENDELPAGGDLHGFADNVANFLDTNKALFGSPTFAQIGSDPAYSITWAAGDQSRWRFETDDPNLGFGPTSIIVAGAGTDAANADYTLKTDGLVNGRVAYLAPGGSDPAADGWQWSSTRWENHLGGDAMYASNDDVLSPDLATTFYHLAEGANPAPTVSSANPGTAAQVGTVAVGDVRGYRSYVALLTQSGTDAPVATVLVNELGEVPVWQYNDVGDYSLFGTAGLFPRTKTVVLIGCPPSTMIVSQYYSSGDSSDVSLSVKDPQDGFNGANGQLINTGLQIFVYP